MRAGDSSVFSFLEHFSCQEPHTSYGQIYYRRSLKYVKAANALADLVATFESRGEHVSHILCGDFNIEPHFPAYQLLKEGRLSEKEIQALKSVEYTRWAPDIEQPSQVKEVCYTTVFSVVTEPFLGVVTLWWGGALRDDTKNGCVTD